MTGIATSLLFLCALAWQDLAIEVQTQAGKPESGTVEVFDKDAIILRTNDIKKTVSYAGISTVQFLTNSKQTGSDSLRIVLSDGSRLQPDQLSTEGQEVLLTISPTWSLRMPVANTRSIQLQSLTEQQQAQWRSVEESRIGGDTLVVIRSPEVLDKIEGLIQEIGAEKVAFKLGDQAIEAPRTKLAGVRYFHAAQPNQKILAFIYDVRGNQWNAASLRGSADLSALDVQLACGAAIKIPWKELASIDFSIGNAIYLADLESIDRQQSSGFRLKVSELGNEQLLGAQIVQMPNAQGSSLKMLGSGSITYRIPADYLSVSGEVVLAPEGEQFTPCAVQIRLEGNIVWEAKLDRPNQPAQFVVKIVPDQRLQLNVQATTKYPVGDVVLWKEPRLLR